MTSHNLNEAILLNTKNNNSDRYDNNYEYICVSILTSKYIIK